MAGIFISYRREDSIAYAGRLYDRLQTTFGKDQVFMDIDTLKPGEDFVEVLQSTVASCDVLIAVIGTRWLTVKDEDGRPRLENPEDFVCLEIGAALGRGTWIIPALVGGAQMPRSTDLPHALKKLARRQAIDLPDKGFHQSVNLLIETVNAVIAAAEEKRGTAPLEKEDTHDLSDTVEAVKHQFAKAAAAGQDASSVSDRDIVEPTRHAEEKGEVKQPTHRNVNSLTETVNAVDGAARVKRGAETEQHGPTLNERASAVSVTAPREKKEDTHNLSDTLEAVKDHQFAKVAATGQDASGVPNRDIVEPAKDAEEGAEVNQPTHHRILSLAEAYEKAEQERATRASPDEREKKKARLPSLCNIFGD